MDRLSRLVLAVVMSAAMAFMVTLLATFLNLGPRPDFVLMWMRAYAVAWPIAALTAFVFMPTARRITDGIVGRMGGKS
jgi:hypothetical protein